MGSALEESLETASEMDLVNMVNDTEGLAYWMNHEAAKDRIPGKDADESITSLRKQRDKAVEVIKARTGLSSHDDLKNYIQGKLKEQEQEFKKRWGLVSKEGAVFVFPGEKGDRIYETLRAYFPCKEQVSGPESMVIARGWESQHVVHVDEREIRKFQISNQSPRYAGLEPEKRGIVKLDDFPEKRTRENGANVGLQWNRIDGGGHRVFYHAGFDDHFECLSFYNLSNMDSWKRKENEVLLTRSCSKPVLVEFSSKDLENMDFNVSIKSKYSSFSGAKNSPWYIGE